MATFDGGGVYPTDPAARFAGLGGVVPIPDVPIATIDAGPLRHDIFRTIRRPTERTRLREALDQGYVRVYTTRHVLAELDRDLPYHAAKAGVEEGVARVVWLQHYRRHLRVVDVDGLFGLLAGDPDVLAVADRHRNDAPLALLTALLGVTAWSEDGDFMILGTGREDYLKHVVATADIGRFEVTATFGSAATLKTVQYVATTTTTLYKKTESAIGRPATVGLAVGLALFLGWLLYDSERRQRLLATSAARAIGRVAQDTLSVSVELHRRHDEATAFLATRRRPDPSPPSAELRLIRALAGARLPLTPTQLATKAVITQPVVEIILDRHAAFVERESGHWQLGSTST